MNTAPPFFLERLDSWSQERSLKEACGLRWRSYLLRRHWNAYMINRNGGTYRPVGYVLVHDLDSLEREIVDIKLLEDVNRSEFSEILRLLRPANSPQKLRLNPMKILEREDYELMAALGAAKDSEGVYRIGSDRGVETGVASGREALTKERLLGSR